MGFGHARFHDHGSFSGYLALWALVSVVILQPKVADTHVWRFSSNRQYTASSAYDFRLQGKIAFRSWARIWKGWALGKCKFFVWLVVHNRFWTADRLARRGLPHLDCCPVSTLWSRKRDHPSSTCRVYLLGNSGVWPWLEVFLTASPLRQMDTQYAFIKRVGV